MLLPFNPPPSSFVTTLKGFMFLDENDAQTEAVVSEIVANTLFSDDNKSTISTTIRRFIAKHRDNVSEDIINIDNVLRFIRSSIIVKRLNLLKRQDIGTGIGTPTPAWNVYLFPPTKDQPAMREWCDIIRKTRFTTVMNKEGTTAAKLFSCTTCLSVDHPAGMCPYPSQPDWISPTPAPAPTPTLPVVAPPVQTNRDNRAPPRGGRGATTNSRGRNATSRKGRTNARA